MARSRNIKPGFFINDELAEIEPIGRLLFAGLWCIADREGRLEDRPKRIKAEVLPYDDCDVDQLLNELAEYGFIIRYEVDTGEKYIQVTNFAKHQNPHKNERDSEIPSPDSSNTSTIQAPEHSNTNPADSLNLIPDSLNLDHDTTTTTTKVQNTVPGTPEEEKNLAAAVVEFYEQNIGLLSPLVADKLSYWVADTENDLVLFALEKAVLAGKRNFSYTEGILRNWSSQGIKTRRGAELAEEKFQQQKEKERARGHPLPPKAEKKREPPMSAEEKARIAEANARLRELTGQIEKEMKFP